MEAAPQPRSFGPTSVIDLTSPSPCPASPKLTGSTRTNTRSTMIQATLEAQLVDVSSLVKTLLGAYHLSPADLNDSLLQDLVPKVHLRVGTSTATTKGLFNCGWHELTSGKAYVSLDAVTAVVGALWDQGIGDCRSRGIAINVSIGRLSRQSAKWLHTAKEVCGHLLLLRKDPMDATSAAALRFNVARHFVNVPAELCVFGTEGCSQRQLAVSSQVRLLDLVAAEGDEPAQRPVSCVNPTPESLDISLEILQRSCEQASGMQYRRSVSR